MLRRSASSCLSATIDLFFWSCAVPSASRSSGESPPSAERARLVTSEHTRCTTAATFSMHESKSLLASWRFVCWTSTKTEQSNGLLELRSRSFTCCSSSMCVLSSSSGAQNDSFARKSPCEIFLRCWQYSLYRTFDRQRLKHLEWR